MATDYVGFDQRFDEYKRTFIDFLEQDVKKKKKIKEEFFIFVFLWFLIHFPIEFNSKFDIILNSSIQQGESDQSKRLEELIANDEKRFIIDINNLRSRLPDATLA